MYALRLTVALFVLTGSVCLPAVSAIAKNSPAQDQAVERFRQCDHFATIRLEHIETSGRVVVRGAEYEAEPFKACMAERATRQQAALPNDPVIVDQMIEGSGA
ncbi:MAG: hypothetical protein C5B48_06900 [Candidatus Rokuibacteriota bacterium]|nr:MAG: hypothetical protein C5B48_06900 [Candidatus Rokubacteria bacterium]